MREKTVPENLGLSTAGVLRAITVISSQDNVRIAKARNELRNALQYGSRERRARARAQLERAETQAINAAIARNSRTRNTLEQRGTIAPRGDAPGGATE